MGQQRSLTACGRRCRSPPLPNSASWWRRSYGSNLNDLASLPNGHLDVGVH